METQITAIIKNIPLYTSYLFSFILLLHVLIKQEIPKIQNLKKIIFAQACIFIGTSIYFTIAQYITWKTNDISQYLLPPHKSIWYFIGYVYTHFFNYIVFTIVFALIAFYAIKLLNKRFNYKFFYKEEKYLCVIGFFINPYPMFLVFIVLVLLANLSIQIISNIKSKNRIPFLNCWIPCIIISLFISSYLINNIPLLKGLIL